MVEKMMIVLPTKNKNPLFITIDITINGFALIVTSTQNSLPEYIGGYEKFEDLLEDLNSQLPNNSKIRALVEIIDNDKIYQEMEKMKEEINRKLGPSLGIPSDVVMDDDFDEEDDIQAISVPMSMKVDTDKYSFDYKEGLISFLKDQYVLIQANKTIGQSS